MIVGIDLGTTNSLIGIYEDHGVRLIPNVLGAFLTPSVVSLSGEGMLLVGQAAKDRLVSHPHESVASFKRWMGTKREIRLGKRVFLPEELSALVIRALLDDAEAALGGRPNEAVISVPAYFSDAQRRATKRAGELAGLRVERLINEPTAAALAYGLTERLDDAQVMVLDLGGGTFDVSILELFSGVVKVHASAGDNYLGGDDFTIALEEYWIRANTINREALKPEEVGQLRRRAEAAKRELASGRGANLIASIGQTEYVAHIDQDEFEALSDHLIQRMRRPIEQALRDARLRGSELSEVVLVGGGSRLPQVAKLAARVLGRLPLRHMAPDEAVAQGACVAAGLKARHVSLQEVVLADVCPHSMGVEVSMGIGGGERSSGHFDPIIERNSTVPVSRMREYFPVHERQTFMELQIFQGESPFTRNNILLGSLKFPILSGNKRDPGVEVRFTYDINGVLQVEAKGLASGLRQELIFIQEGSDISEAEARRRMIELANLKTHPRDDQQSIAAIARAERLYSEALAEDRQILQQMLIKFQSVLSTQDRDLVAAHLEAFSKALDEFEEVRFR
ncbi:Hsp70 family protein [Pseudoxanthomonas sp. JBR18]|uniref:Hsp70 family protein n=1 Tax=Pseudoxanthomonas sp. JBR18 TaxID=2969308 RepID=UPI0023062D64|nr:Hsp70 family protein [Pseudoxanthomonas sp. JBR18]WCE03472.1 Hsp70 family protein [Pseudoxanthomonas sp. JBR18]